MKRPRFQGIGEAAVVKRMLPHLDPETMQRCRVVAPHPVGAENGGMKVRQPAPLQIRRDVELLPAIQDVIDCRLDGGVLAIGAIALGQGEVRHRDLQRKA